MRTPQDVWFGDFMSELLTFYSLNAVNPLLRVRMANLSIHPEHFAGQCAGSGRGRVWHVHIPYIFSDESEPEESGCVHVPQHMLDMGLTITASRDAVTQERRLLTVEIR